MHAEQKSIDTEFRGKTRNDTHVKSEMPNIEIDFKMYSNTIIF